MGDITSYSLADFLLFSPETYWRLFERANELYWPAPLAGLALGLVMLAAALWSRGLLVRLAALIAGAGLIWIAWAFLWQLFQPINFAMDYAVPAFAAAGLLFLIFAVAGGRAARRPSAVPAPLIFLAVVIYPYLAPVMGRDVTGAEIVGIAPDPTAMAAGALALLAGRLWWRILMAAVPVLWLAFSALTLFTMGAPEWPIPTAAALLVLFGLYQPAAGRAVMPVRG
ncbi:MAG: hypothetical protein ACMVY4_05795 [Minwuia sp.]|uniref:hypothetical protein n=1 Tax=Minwuia sp. TaxID=2493630 RepID=UPI003A83EED8